MRATLGRRPLPVGLPTLAQMQALARQAEDAAQTAAADAVAAAQPAIDAALQQAAADAAPAAADAIRAQVAADADRAAAAVAEVLPGQADRVRIGTGQWVTQRLFDMLADDPALVFAADFARGQALTVGSGTMDNAFSVTRASPGRYLDATGVLRSFGPGRARIGDRGLLIEPGAVNLAQHSLDLTLAPWTVARATVAAAGRMIAGLPAVKLDATAVTGTHFVQQRFTAVAGTAYTFSVFAAPGELNFLHIQTAGVAFPAMQGMSFDLTTGAVLTRSGAPVGRCVKVAGGWRCEMTVTAAAAGNGFANLLASDSGEIFAFTPAAPVGIHLGGGQIEAGPRATSLIETGGAVGSRAADIVALRPGWWPTAQGSAWAKVEADHTPGAYLLGAAGTTDSPLMIGTAPEAAQARAGGVVLTATAATLRWGRGIETEIVSAWSASGRALGFKGSAPVTDATPAGAAMAFLGSRGADAAGDVMSGYVRALLIWNRRLEAV